MSDRWWTDAERAAVQIECQHCHARPGAWCVTAWSYNDPGKPVRKLHGIRLRTSASAGRLPIEIPGE